MEDASERYGYGAGRSENRPFELTDTSMTEGAFFELESPVAIAQRRALSTVGGSSVIESATTPTHAYEDDDEGNEEDLKSLETGGAHTMMKPRPEIILRWKRFGAALLASVLLVVGLTTWFWIGIPVKTIEELVNDSTKSEPLLREYNTYSGVVMGIFEAFLGIGFANFFPAFTVYVHNLKWYPGDDPLVKTSKVKKVLLLLFFPAMMIAVGNGFSAVQAGASTLRLKVMMNSSSLGDNGSNYTRPEDISTLKPYLLYHEETILKTAVWRQSTPFTIVSSKCQRDVKELAEEFDPALKRMGDIDSTAAVFGFPVKEWSREIYPDIPNHFSPEELDLDTSFELLFQGQALLERAVGSLPSQRCPSFVTGGNETCRTRAKETKLDNLYGYFNGTKTKTKAALTEEIVRGMQFAFFGDLDDSTPPTVEYLSFDISPQIKAEYMTFNMSLKRDFEFGLAEDTIVTPEGCKGSACEYRYRLLDSDAFCGSNSCILPDWQADMIPKKHASMMQYKKKCDPKETEYDDSLQSFIPGGCESEENAVFFSGFGSRIFLDSFGMMKSEGSTELDLPYAKNPRRAVRLTWGKLVWKYEDLAKPFGANCNDTSTSDACFGLKHRLQPSGRHVLMGKNHLPPKIATSDFRQPISLFQLNAPSVMSPRATKGTAALEYVDSTSFNKIPGATIVMSVSLAPTKCAALADSYITHVRSNVLYLYEAYQPMYMSALLYIFQNAAVTKVRSTSGSQPADATAPTPGVLSASALAATRLAGDRSVSMVRIQNTEVGVYTVWIGCIVLVLLAFVTLAFPNERARLTPMMGKNARAERFVAVQTEEVYPNLVYMKRFRIGKTGEALKLSEFAVEAVSLHHKMEEDEQVFL